ncbi:hypothetical protein BHU72_02030 [Desulfuribacillus stibiiarsenatis]|uniref:HPt domain-containing protein n=1 Tax=Desulfuribacillus stibiiarsenatis TaxID=1390249 RepID=A0A1E5L661_9FIRM|nr:hypothetical protein [Desulfuribacillus stibiiarsenatis]OEH85601.1 hypothetical protein BHU72_02030 [Desulfuribacillus stibiiarsenatis]
MSQNHNQNKSIESIVKECQVLYLQDSKNAWATIDQYTLDLQSDEIINRMYFDRIYQQIHSLKGIAKTIHFHEIHEICETIAHSIKQNQYSTTTQLIEDLSLLKRAFETQEAIYL